MHWQGCLILSLSPIRARLGEPWHFLLAPLCIILVAVPLEFHWRWSWARAEWMGVYGAKRL